MVLEHGFNPPATLLVRYDMQDERTGASVEVVETYDMTNEDARWRLLDDLKEAWAAECCKSIQVLTDAESNTSH